MNPLFVHDPRRGSTLHDWFSLDGNPDIGSTWTTTDLAYRDDAGELQLMRLPLTPAEFALGETRFRKQFTRLAAELEDVAVRIDEYVELSREEQAVRVPFIHATDEDQRLIKVECSASVGARVEDGRRYWQRLQYLSGGHEAKLTALHTSDLADLRSRYEQAMRDREASIDSIAEAMSSLATSSRAPVGHASGAPAQTGPARMPAVPADAAPAPGGLGTLGAEGSAPPDAPIYLAEVDLPKCNDCGTCYQELPQLFEPHSMVIDGAVQKVARMIPGALETVEMTPEILKRVDRVRKTCDAEIIQ
jgi:pyruvate-ferredoxin/flavodoxin oxidoreductase